MNRILLTSTILAGTLLTATAGATHKAGGFSATVRGIYITPDVSSTLPLDVKAEVVPEFDLNYFLLPNVALELIVSASRNSVYLAGDSIGEVTLLPPTLTVHYELDIPNSIFGPYAGIGVNYTKFYNVTLPAPLDIDRDSFGFAIQAGVNLNVTESGFINLDAKKLWISTDVKSAGATVDTLDIDPWVWGLGIGFRF